MTLPDDPAWSAFLIGLMAGTPFAFPSLRNIRSTAPLNDGQGMFSAAGSSS
jgi:hypothetical protein